MKAMDLMNTNVISITPDESVSLAARLLSRHNIGALPVISPEGRLRGIVTDRDIVLRCVAGDDDPERTPVREIMTRGVLTAAPTDDMQDVSRLMSARQVRRIPIVEGNRVVGMLALADLARTRVCRMEASGALTEISSNIRRK
jgi:CBS domain-containing protein